MVIGITRLKRDPEWLLRDTVRCRAMAGVFLAVPVGMAAVIRCQVAMAGLQAPVDILLMVKLVITAATRVDTPARSDTTVYPVTLCDVLCFFKVAYTKLLAIISLLTTTGVLESTSSSLEYIRSSLRDQYVFSLSL